MCLGGAISWLQLTKRWHMLGNLVDKCALANNNLPATGAGIGTAADAGVPLALLLLLLLVDCSVCCGWGCCCLLVVGCTGMPVDWF